MKGIGKRALALIALGFAAACGEVSEVTSPPTAASEAVVCSNSGELCQPGASLDAPAAAAVVADLGGANAVAQILNPDAAYGGSTTLIDISGIGNFSNFSSISGGGLTVTFSSTMNKRHAEVSGWASWGDPPFTELYAPHVFYSGATVLTLNLSAGVSTFGFEIEPDPFDLRSYTVEFIDAGANATVGVITRTAHGSHGARLIAGTFSSPIDRVRITTDVGFAMGQVRFAFAPTNEAPVADAGADETLECTGSGGCSVALDGTGSSDADGSIVAWEWKDSGGAVVGTSASVVVSQGLGSETYTLKVTDDDGATDTDAVTITTEDTTAPTLTVAATPGELWPPNHQYVAIALDVSASDEVDPGVTITATAQSDEADDAKGNGDGATTGDVKAGAAASSNAAPLVAFDPVNDALELRAERAASGSGRTYTISVTATDASGNATTQSVTVVVPHSQN